MILSTTDSSEPTLVDIILPLELSEDLDAQKAALAKKLGTTVAQITEWRLRKHSIDARQRTIKA